MLTMEEALKQSTTPIRFAANEIVKGTVIEVRNKEVLVDIGYESEGVIPGNEFDDIKTVKIGDVVDVLIEKLEDKEGMVILSKEKAEFQQNWDKILTICNEGGRISGRVKSIVKGGLVVNIGVEAFLPASQIDVITPKNLAQFVGNTYDFKVVKINQERQNIVLSAANSSKPNGPSAARNCWPIWCRAIFARARLRTSPTSARSLTSTALTVCCTSPT